jgi:undecaprenyl-diphosphatase
VGGILKIFIEKIILAGHDSAEMEHLFGRLDLIAVFLFAVGVLIIVAGHFSQKNSGQNSLTYKSATTIGIIQGVCVPLRGFSRSGATISVSLFHKISSATAEEFSFGLALILTPIAIARMIWRLNHHGVVDVASSDIFQSTVILQGMMGLVFSFVAGLIALRWLSHWLEGGRWHYFGYYNLIAAVAIWILNEKYFSAVSVIALG